MKKLNLISAGNLIFRLLLPILFLPFWLTASTLKVEAITFSGNRYAAGKELRDILNIQKGKEFNSRALNLDKIRIANFYRLRGFLEVYVESNIRREGDKIYVDFSIREGFRFRLQGISFFGNDLLKEPHIRRKFEIADGDPYEAPLIEQGLNSLENYYMNHGKPYALFSEEIVINDDSLITVEVRITENATVTIEEILFEGLSKVKRFLLRREMTFAKSDQFSREKIEKSQSNMYGTGLFKFVNYRLDPIGGDESKVKLVWQLAEKKSRYMVYRFGVGFEKDAYSGNQTSFDFTVEVGHRNLFGTGRSLSLGFVPSFYYGKVNQDDGSSSFSNPGREYSLSFVEPWVLNTRTPGTLRLAYAEREPPLTPEPVISASAGFSISHDYGNFWSYTAGISLERVTVDSDSLLRALNPSDRDLIYSLRFDPVRDKRDNFLNPTRGHLTQIRNNLVYATGRDSTDDAAIRNLFYRLQLQWNRYQKFAWKQRWVLATRVQAGGIVSINGAKPVRLLPVTERFYLGGASTVRGYTEQGIGEQIENSFGESVPLGGKYLYLMNAELRIPLFWLFYGQLFIDSGNIWRSVDELKNFSLKTTAGPGIAIMTPFGPIRFDYGFKILPVAKNGESIGEFHIGISFAF